MRHPCFQIVIGSQGEKCHIPFLLWYTWNWVQVRLIYACKSNDKEDMQGDRKVTLFSKSSSGEMTGIIPLYTSSKFKVWAEGRGLKKEAWHGRRAGAVQIQGVCVLLQCVSWVVVHLELQTDTISIVPGHRYPSWGSLQERDNSTAGPLCLVHFKLASGIFWQAYS